MEKTKVRLSKEVEKSIRDFEKTTMQRKLQSAFKDGITLDDFVILTTLGTGTFGKVKLVKLKKYPELPPMALKMLKKKEMIRLKQVEHVKSEKIILERVNHPFIIGLYIFLSKKLVKIHLKINIMFIWF